MKIRFLLLLLTPIILFANSMNDLKHSKEGLAIIYKKGLASIDNKDVRLAVNLLQQEVFSKSKHKINTEFSNDLNHTIQEFQKSKIDIFSLDFIYYLKNYKKINPYVGGRWVLLEKKDNKFREFYLIANKKSKINSLKDLKSKTVGLVKNDSMQELYLNTLLLEDLHTSSEKYLNKIKYYTKPSRALIKLFFNQIDACIVSKYSWNTAIELNPQLKKKLKIIKHSKDIFPPVVLTLIHKNSPYFSKLYEEFVFTSQMNVKTKEILRMYQTVQSMKLGQNDIEPILQYFDKYKKLKRKYQ